MKNINAILLLVLFTFTLSAQDKTTEQKKEETTESQETLNQQENLNSLGNLTGAVGGVGFDNRYEGLKGHPYVYNEWYSGIVKIDGKFVEDKNASYKVDIEERVIVAQFGKGNYRTFPMGTFEEIHLQTGKKVASFIIRNANPNQKNALNIQFLEVLNSGSYRLLKQHEKFYRPADYKGGYSTDKRYADFRIENTFFIQMPDGQLKKIKLKKKSILKALPNQKAAIETFVKTFKSELETENEVASLLRGIKE